MKRFRTVTTLIKTGAGQAANLQEPPSEPEYKPTREDVQMAFAIGPEVLNRLMKGGLQGMEYYSMMIRTLAQDL